MARVNKGKVLFRNNGVNFTELDRKNLKSDIRNYNSKITRVMKKKGYDVENLPPRLSAKEIENKVRNGEINRKELNDVFRQTKAWLKSGSEELVTNKHGVSITKHQLAETRVKVNRSNKERAKEWQKVKDLMTHSENTETGVIVEERIRNEHEMFEPQNFNFDNYQRKSTFNRFAETLEKRALDSYSDYRKEVYIENLKSAIHSQMGIYEDELLNLIEQVDRNKLVELLYTHLQGGIDWIYDPAEVEARATYFKEALVNYGGAVYEGELITNI